jgi:hypothetical protein
VFVPNWDSIGPAGWQSMLGLWFCVHIYMRSALMHAHSPTRYVHGIVATQRMFVQSWADQPGCLAAYSKHNRTERDRAQLRVIQYTSTCVSGGWTYMRLRRKTRSSTCVCLRVCNYFSFLSSLCARSRRTLALYARGGCAALLNSCFLERRACSRSCA